MPLRNGWRGTPLAPGWSGSLPPRSQDQPHAAGRNQSWSVGGVTPSTPRRSSDIQCRQPDVRWSDCSGQPPSLPLRRIAAPERGSHPWASDAYTAQVQSQACCGDKLLWQQSELVGWRCHPEHAADGGHGLSLGLTCSALLCFPEACMDSVSIMA